jgi:hypothetical protein
MVLAEFLTGTMMEKEGRSSVSFSLISCYKNTYIKNVLKLDPSIYLGDPLGPPDCALLGDAVDPVAAFIIGFPEGLPQGAVGGVEPRRVLDASAEPLCVALDLLEDEGVSQFVLADPMFLLADYPYTAVPPFLVNDFYLLFGVYWF